MDHVRTLTSHALRGSFEWSHLARTLWYQWSRATAEEASQATEELPRRATGFDNLHALARDNDFETLVAIFPNLEEETPYPESDEHRAVTLDARSREFSVIDLLPNFQAASRGNLLQIRGRCRDMHPDEAGHRIAAQRMEQFIRENYARSQ